MGRLAGKDCAALRYRSGPVHVARGDRPVMILSRLGVEPDGTVAIACRRSYPSPRFGVSSASD